MSIFGRTGALIFLYLMLPALGRAEQAITLCYNERPPYLVSAPDGSAHGLTATPAANAFKAAGVPMTWLKIPTNRQLAAVKDVNGLNCAIGWFKNPDREQFAKFTKAIYRDKPTVILANREFAVKEGGKLESVLTAKGVRVLVKDQFSYGPFIDGLLAGLRPNLISTVGENSQMLQMVQAGRADFMFLAEEEAYHLVEQAGFSMNNFQLIRFPDMPSGEKRYIMCSKGVPDEVIVRLNKAISFE